MLDLCLIVAPNPPLTHPDMYMPLGLCYIASMAEKEGYSVGVVDFRTGDKPLPKAKFYGFSCATPEIDFAKNLAKQVQGKTIVGGAHPSLLPDDCIGFFDYIVMGEGEKIITSILNGFTRPGIITASRIRDLDTIPFPAWDKLAHPFSKLLFAGERYGETSEAAIVIASRGCPFNCAFCANIYHTPVVFRSVDNIINEIEELIKRGIHYFRFEDDNFTLHPQLFNLCIALGKLNIHYKVHARADMVTKERCQLLSQTGCAEHMLGVESADQRVLDLNNKKTTVEDNRNAIRLIKEAGMLVKTYWVMGLPGETDETLELNKQFVRDTKPDKWTVSTFTPYPGCPVYNNPKQFGVEIIDWDFSRWWNFVEKSYVHRLKDQTPEQMWARYLEFYNFMKEGKWQV